MKQILTAVLFSVLSVFIFSCKSKDAAAGGDPKTVITAFFERMSKKDIDGATKLCTKDSKSTMEMMKKAIEAADKMKDLSKDAKQDDGTEDFKNMIIGEAKINGDEATVTVTNKKDNKTVDFPLKKEGGSWKVDFTMSTLMKMGMEGAQNSGEDLFKTNTEDSTNNQLPENNPADQNKDAADTTNN